MNPDRTLLARLLPAWRRAFGNRPASVSEAGHNPEVSELLHSIGPSNIARGQWIRRHAGQRLDGLRFELASGRAPLRWIAHAEPPVLLRELSDAGVTVRLTDGTLTATGTDEALARMLPLVREQHDELHEFLTAARATAAALLATMNAKP